MYASIPKELRELNQWVVVREGSKAPLSCITGRGASTSNQDDWCDFELACHSIAEGHADYLGFVFNDNGIVGIDLDSNVYDDWGLLTPFAAQLIGACKSYTERSKSGRGIHILIKGDIPFKGRNNRSGVEVYKQGRYFIMTGKTLLYTEIVKNQTAIDELVENHCQIAQSEKDNYTHGNKIYSPIWKVSDNGRFKLRPHYPIIKQGCRNISLLSLGGGLVDVGYNRKQILDELQYSNSVACKPPLDSQEVENICKSVWRYKR